MMLGQTTDIIHEEKKKENKVLSVDACHVLPSTS